MIRPSISPSRRFARERKLFRSPSDRLPVNIVIFVMRTREHRLNAEDRVLSALTRVTHERARASVRAFISASPRPTSRVRRRASSLPPRSSQLFNVGEKEHPSPCPKICSTMRSSSSWCPAPSTCQVRSRDTRCPRYHRSRRASPPAGRLEGSRTRASFTPLKEVVRPFSDASRSRAERAGPARRVPEHTIRTECARTRAYNAPRASLGAPLVPHRTRS